MPLLGGRSWEEWVSRYGQSHENPVNRVCHTVGIPLIAISIPMFLAALFVPGGFTIETQRHRGHRASQ
jgi:uncharacterized membrane protein YGL010W